MKKIIAIALFALTPFAFASAQAGGLDGCQDFACVVTFATGMINQLVVVLIGVGLLLFIWGLVKYVAAAGDEDKIREAKRFIVFGLIAFFVMMSVWGLTNILVRTFFPQGGMVVPQFR